MKLKLEKSTISMLGVIATYGLGVDFQDCFVKMFARSALDSLIIKFAGCKDKIKDPVGLQIEPSEALAFFWASELYNQDYPGKIEYLISLQYFIEPIRQQIPA
jgi:hypothetical protein